MSYREARTKHDKFKLMTYIKYIQQSWREKKEKHKKLIYINYTTASCKRGRHLYTTTALSCCIPASHCHPSATLQTISITVVNLQTIELCFDILSLFKVFI